MVLLFFLNVANTSWNSTVDPFEPCFAKVHGLLRHGLLTGMISLEKWLCQLKGF